MHQSYFSFPLFSQLSSPSHSFRAEGRKEGSEGGRPRRQAQAGKCSVCIYGQRERRRKRAERRLFCSSSLFSSLPPFSRGVQGQTVSSVDSEASRPTKREKGEEGKKVRARPTLSLSLSFSCEPPIELEGENLDREVRKREAVSEFRIIAEKRRWQLLQRD